MKYLSLSSLLLVVACSAAKDEPETGTTGATAEPGTTTTSAATTDTGDASPTTAGPTDTTADTTAASTTTASTTTAETTTPGSETTEADTTGPDPTGEDPVCGAGPAPGETFTIDFGGQIGSHTFEQAGNTGCHTTSDADSALVSLVWSSTTNGGFTISAALFSGDYASLGELVGHTLPYSPSNQLAADINAPGLGSYEAKGAEFGLHISTLTEGGITGCLVGFDAFVREADNDVLPISAPIPFACGS